MVDWGWPDVLDMGIDNVFTVVLWFWFGTGSSCLTANFCGVCVCVILLSPNEAGPGPGFLTSHRFTVGLSWEGKSSGKPPSCSLLPYLSSLTLFTERVLALLICLSVHSHVPWCGWSCLARTVPGPDRLRVRLVYCYAQQMSILQGLQVQTYILVPESTENPPTQ